MLMVRQPANISKTVLADVNLRSAHDRTELAAVGQYDRG